MGTYPTSGTRGASSRRSADGFQGSSAIPYAAAGFLAPAAGSAAAAEFGVAAPAAAAEVAIPGLEAASQVVSGAVARTALVALSPVLLRLLPGLAIAYGLYLAAQKLAELLGNLFGPGAGRLGPGWVEDTAFRCGGSMDFTSNGLWPDCGQAYVVSRDAITPGQTTLKFWKYDSDFHFDAGRPNPRVWAFGQSVWHWQGEGAWVPPNVDGTDAGPSALLRPGRATLKPGTARLQQALIGDSLVRPGEELTQPPVLPYRLLPLRVDNPYRSDVEQTDRGLRVRPVGDPRNVLEPGQEVVDNYRQELDRVLRDFSRPKPLPDGTYPEWGWPDAPADPRPAPLERPTEAPGRPVEAPGRPEALPEPATAPTRPATPPGLPGETLPGWVAHPATPVVPPVGTVTVQPPAIAVELPPGAHGPTITIGGGPPVGPHLREPPGPREKERKSRYLRPGASLLIRRGVNPVTEALDALDCVYKSLPKGLRWKLEKENWKAQRADAKKRGVTLRPSPARNDPTGTVSIKADAIGLTGQSISVPGLSVRKHPFVDPTGNYYKPMSPQQKAAAVYRHAGSIDIDATVKCIAADQLEDMLYGRFGTATQKASRRLGLSTGLQTGPTF